MKNRGPILFSLTLIVAIVFAFIKPVDNVQKEAALMQSVLTDLAYYHYQPATIDDEFSQKVYDLFMKRLDGNRRWLTQQDVAQLQAYQTQLDDDVKVGNYAFLDLAVALQEQGINKTQEYYREFLSQPFDFTVEETYESDGEKKPFAKDDEELKEYWRKAMKFETMTRLADKVEKKEEGHEDFKDKTYEELEAEARKELLKVYDDWYKRLEKRKREDHVSMFLNCITNVFDPHSEYYQPIDKQNFDIGMSGRLEGIGARLQTDGDYTKVAEIIVGGPAWKGGELEANDRIMKVAQGDDPEWTDITGMVINDVVQLIRGTPGTKVRLYVKKADGSTQEISIIRDVVILEEGFAKSLIIETPDNERIGFLYLPKFYADFNHKDGRRCAADVAVELEKLKQENVDGIILDLRNNGGGS
ncbi:MAG: tail-specific protease, partial [Bacteroidetes bacterium]